MCDVIEQATRFQLTMSATVEGIDRADARLASYLETRRVPVDVFAVRILVRESLLNAVTHGSGKDRDKTVQLDLLVEPHAIVLTVEDSGDGFPWRQGRPDLNVLDGDGGRGLALMSIYSDQLEFNDKGNRVVLRKSFKVAEPSGGSMTRDG